MLFGVWLGEVKLAQLVVTMAWMKKQIIVVLVTAIIVGIANNNFAYSTDITYFPRESELEAIALSAAITGTILSKSNPRAGLLLSAGCFVWQQPGVALSITSIWQDGQAVELYFNADKFHSFLTAIPDYTKGEPFLHPPEPDDVDGFYIEPQVYLLSGEQSQARLQNYMRGYNIWVELNGGMEFIQPGEEALLTDFAVVFIDSAGPLEFHFRLEEGKLKLQHLFLWDFFSA